MGLVIALGWPLLHGRAATTTAPSASEPSAGARPAPAAGQVRYWKFDGILRVYKKGRLPYIEVSLKGKRLIWDPVGLTLTAYAGFDKTGLEKLYDMTIALNRSELGGGVELDWNTEYNQCTHEPFSQFLILRDHGIARGEFYLIERFDPPFPVYRGGCDNPRRDESFRQSYSDAILPQVLRLPSGPLLLFFPGRGIVVELRRIPDVMMSFDNQLFIVPAKLLTSQLDAAEDTLSARFEVVRRILAAAIPISPSSPAS